MSDQELLELAARAAGVKKHEWSGYYEIPTLSDGTLISRTGGWNPLTDDGDALRLSVKLRMILDPYAGAVAVPGKTIATINEGDIYAATRQAIVQLAAELGKEISSVNKDHP